MLRNPRGHSARNHTEVLLRSSQVSLQRNNHTAFAAEAGCDALLSVHVHLGHDPEKYVKSGSVRVIMGENAQGQYWKQCVFFMQEIKVV